jgi:hypothetical protein
MFSGDERLAPVMSDDAATGGGIGTTFNPVSAVTQGSTRRGIELDVASVDLFTKISSRD